MLVRGFFDSTNDGTGDLRGLTEKLDYLQWLGIDCIWLLPFYDSPLRDGGYDIADFFTVLPEYGDIEDARELIEEAHAARHARRRRHGDEPHLAISTPGSRRAARTAPTRRPTGTCGATTTSAGARRG